MNLVARIDRWAEWPIALLAAPAPFHITMAVYYLLLGVVTALAFSGASIDTTEQMLFAQDWALRYDDANPPLFTWLVKLAELVFGPGLAAVAFVKFGSLWAMHAFLHALGRTLRLTPALTVLIALSPLTLYYLAWDSTYTYSHSLLMTTACCASAWAAARVVQKRSWARFATLGIVLCCGLLAKYNFSPFALALLMVIATDPRTRRTTVWRRLTASVAFMLPALALVVGEAGQLANAANGRLAVQGDAGTVAAASLLLPTVAAVIWQFLLPMLPLYAVAFWPALRHRPERPIPTLTRMLGMALVIAGAMMLVGLVAIQATEIRTPYVFMFVLVPVVLLLRLAGYPRLQRSIRLFVMVPLFVMVAVPVGLPVKAAVEPADCRRCFLAFDYAALADDLRQHGFTHGTIVGRLDDQGRVGGLRPHFPDSRLISLRYPDFVPPARQTDGQCALVWYDGVGVSTAEKSLIAFAENVLATPVPTAQAPFTLAVPLTGDRAPLTIRARLWTPADGQCR